MTGHYDPLARHLTLTASPADWLDRPADYVTVDLDGFVDDAADVLRGTVRGPGCRDFLVSKRGP
jgi:hypothetical protein